jgi:hypothetical protein
VCVHPALGGMLTANRKAGPLRKIGARPRKGYALLAFLSGGGGRRRYRLPQDGDQSSVLLLVTWTGFPPPTAMV